MLLVGWAVPLIGLAPVLAAAPGAGVLTNTDFSQLADGRFVGWGPFGSYRVDGKTARVECTDASQSAGLVQIVKCDPPLAEPFTATARARAENVGSGGDFCVHLDLIHTDGSPSWAHVAGFSRGTHDWERASVDIVPPKPVAEVRFHLLLRGTTGRAWFADPELKPTPLALTRFDVVEGLWGRGSLSLRAETNLPAVFQVEGLPVAGTRLASGMTDQRLAIDLAVVPKTFWGRPVVVSARARRDPANQIRSEQVPRRIQSAGEVLVRGWLADATERVFADSLPPPTSPGGLALDAVRGGHVSFQVGLLAHPDGPVGGVEVAVGDLTAEGGGRIAGESWQRYRVGFIRNEQPARHPKLERHGPAWWPDVLLTYRPLLVPAREARSVVLTLRVPEGQRPGLYSGEVTVRAGAGVQKLPLRVQVHPFVVPARLKMKTAFALMDGFLEKVYGTITPELRRAYTAFVLDHRLNPDDISRTRLPDLDELSWAKDHGLNAFNILNLVPEPKEKVTWVCFAPVEAYTDAFKQRLIERLDAFVPELKKRGLLEYAYIYGFDERGAEYLPIIRDYFALIKQRYPGVKTLSTCWPPVGTDPATLNIDWYCPLSNKYDAAEAEKARARGGEMWWYICMGPTWPYANWLFEYPLIEARLVWWQAWQNRVDGFLYWGLNVWDRPRNDKPIPDDADEPLTWSNTPFEPLHGDGVLLYPGEHGPLGSLRLLNIRDGLEDTAILDAAERALGRAEVERIARDVSRGMTDFTRDIDLLHRVRRSLLERLNKAP